MTSQRACRLGLWRKRQMPALTRKRVVRSQPKAPAFRLPLSGRDDLDSLIAVAFATGMIHQIGTVSTEMMADFRAAIAKVASSMNNVRTQEPVKPAARPRGFF